MGPFPASFFRVFYAVLSHIFSPILSPILSPISSPIFPPSSLLSLSKPSTIFQGRPSFLVSTPDIHIRACTALQAMSTEQAKGCWRGLNPDEQIEAALRDGLSEDRSGIDSNPVHRKLAPSSQPRYDAMWDFWEACVINLQSQVQNSKH